MTVCEALFQVLEIQRRAKEIQSLHAQISQLKGENGQVLTQIKVELLVIKPS